MRTARRVIVLLLVFFVVGLLPAQQTGTQPAGSQQPGAAQPGTPSAATPAVTPQRGAQQGAPSPEGSVDTSLTVMGRDDSVLPVPEPAGFDEDPVLPSLDASPPDAQPVSAFKPPIAGIPPPPPGLPVLPGFATQ